MKNLSDYKQVLSSYLIYYNTTNTDDTIRNSSVLPRAGYTEGTTEDNLRYLSTRQRHIFFAIFLLVYIVAFLGNIAAIYVTSKRAHRYIQRSLTISLALTDLIMATAYTINYLETFSHPLINWTIGAFMCSMIPYLQIFGVVASSAALVAIALDRYRNVVHATKKRWNPSLWCCALGVGILWATSAGISYPIYTYFQHKKITVVIYDDTASVPLYPVVMYMCITTQKDELMVFYLCIATTVFLPMLLMFMWLYYNIAKLVWYHRKPLSSKFQKKQETSMETMTSQVKTDESISISRIVPKAPAMKRKNVSVERKIRTFKIILVLMFAFFLCRIPYWTFNILKLMNTYNQPKHWIMTYAFHGLALLNCALNPFLYTFLNETISVLTKIANVINDFVCKICCCCISNTEFDEFERENPFIVEKYNKQPISRIGSPHLNRAAQRSSRVQFEEPKPMDVKALEQKLIKKY